MRICKNKTIPVFLYEPYDRKFYVQVNATNMVLTGRMSFKPASQINCHRIADSKQKQVSVNFFSFFFSRRAFVTCQWNTYCITNLMSWLDCTLETFTLQSNSKDLSNSKMHKKENIPLSPQASKLNGTID